MRSIFSYIFISLVIFFVPIFGVKAQNITATSFSYTPPTVVSKPNPLSNASTKKSVNIKSSALGKTAGATANQVNLQGFLNKVRANGKNIPEIEGIVNQIKVDVATSTDLTGLFLRQPGIIPFTGQVSQSSPLKDRLLSFVNYFKPKEASAVSTLPFGGPLLYSYLCTCSYTWIVWVGPTASAATSNMILDYIPFSQAFMKYNIPYTSLVLGKYSPSSSMCYIYYGYGCINLPITQGLITPQVGSSAY